MNDINALYQDAIKRYAEAAHGRGQLSEATGEAKLDNPLCGDRVRMQVTIRDHRIEALAHDTKGCLLCRAAASLLGQRAAGQDEAAIRAVADTLDSMLKGAALEAGVWPELSMFEPARAYPSRHRCILLPFRALLDAMRDATHNRGAR